MNELKMDGTEQSRRFLSAYFPQEWLREAHDGGVPTKPIRMEMSRRVGAFTGSPRRFINAIKGAAMKQTILFLLVFLSAGLFAQDSISQADLTILGAALSVGPVQQTVPLQTPTVVHTLLGAAGNPITVDASYVVKGELSGPQLSSPITLTTHPNDDFQIPGLNLPGDYVLSDIRLEKDGRFISYAEPESQVGFLVKQILVTSVTSRPLTLEEIQARGIVIDASSYKVIELAIGLKLESGTYDITFPIVWTAEGPQIIASGGGGGWGPGQVGVKAPKFNPPQIAPFDLKVEWPAGEEDKPKPSVSIPGIIVIPTDIAFLNQFFSVMLMATNDAPKGDPLVIRDLFAKLELPAGLREAQTNPPVPLGTFIPVKDLGPDEVLGTADDLTIIVGQATGKAEWNVEGLKEGNHIVNIRLEGTLEGLPVGPVPIKSRTQGMVIVRDPQFAFNVSHPGVVRKDEEYDTYLTITNTSNTAANLLSVNIPQNQIVGSMLLDMVGPEGSQRPDSSTILIQTLLSHESASIRLRLLATQTGQVTATAARATVGTVDITLTMGVGERGIPLSPTSLVFPAFIDRLPQGLTRYAIDLMGLGYSLATAPPGSVSADLPLTSESVIQQRGWELALAARYVQMGVDPFDVIAGFTLDWLGNREEDYGFDELRRTTAKGRRLNQEIKAVFESHLAEEGSGFDGLLEDLHAFQCQATPFIAVLLRSDPSAAALGILNPETGQVSIGAYGESGYRREVSHAEIFSLEDGSSKAQLAVLGAPYHWDDQARVPYAYEIQIIGRPGADPGGQNVTLSVLRGDADGSFEILDYGTITVYPSPIPFALAPVSITGAGNATVMLNGIWTTVDPDADPLDCPAFDAVAVVQDPYSDPIGRAVVVVFNQKPALTGVAAEDLAHFTLDAHIDRAEVPIRDLVRDLYDVDLQRDGRTAILSFKSPVSPWSTNTLLMRGLDPASPNDQFDRPVTRAAEFQATGAIVGGQVIGPDGQPVPNAPVELWEKDRSDLDGVSFMHVTAVTMTNAEGYYVFDYVRSKDPCMLRGYDPATGESGEVGYKTTNEAFHWLNIVMLARGNIRGTVKYPDGTIPEMARVIASSGVFGEHQTVGVNPATGEYTLSRLPVGNIALTAQDNLGNTIYANAYIAYGGQIVIKDIVLNKKADPGVGTVRGHVYYSDATPVGGTWVGVYLAEGGGERLLGWGTTDETGQFGFQNIPEGTVYLKAYDPRTQKVGGTVAVTVLRDSTVTADIIISDLMGSISGRITHRDGVEPVNGAIVYLSGTAWVTSTDADGEFRFDELPLGSYLVEALYIPERERGSKNAAITAPGEEVRVLIDISNSTGGIQGTVIGLDDDQRAEVNIVVGGYSARRVTTDSDGFYVIDDLPAGTYELHAHPALPVKSTVNAGSTTTTIRYNGEMATADIVLSGSRMIEVNTQMSTGVEGEYYWVIAPFKYRSRIVNEYGVIEWMDEYVSGGRTNGTSTGVAFGPVMVGPVQIIAGDPSFGQKSVQIELKSLDPDPRPVTITLDALCTVSGTVVSWTDGITPVDDREVVVTYDGPDNIPRQVTTTDGTFKFPLVPKGGFEITATDGTHKGRAGGYFAFAGQILEGLEIRLLKVGRVEVEVLAPPDYQPVDDATVFLKETHWPHEEFSGTTGGSEPRAVFDQVREGTFSVTATWLDVEGGATHTIAGRANGIMDEEQGTVQVQVFLGEYARLHGRVINPETYAPAPFAQVWLGGTVSDYTTTDADGNFYFAYLPLGTYGVTVLDPASGRSGRASGIVLDQQDEDPNVEILLESRGEVMGDVLYPDHLRTSPFATVKLINHGVEPFSTLTSADINGRFSFVGISRGPFDLYAWAVDSPRQGRASDELFTEGETREVDIILQAAGRVTGRITDWNEIPVTGTTTDFKTEFSQKMLSGSSWRSQQAGPAFSYQEVLVGKMFTITADELIYPFHKGHATGTLDEEGQIVDLNIKLYPIGHVAVYVEMADGSPAGAVEVSLDNSGPYNDSRNYSATNDNGYLRWDDIGYGDFTVKARKWIPGSSAYLRGSANGRIDEDGALTEVTIALEETGSVVGTVFLPDGVTPAAGAHVYIHSGTRVLYFRTDSQGRFVDLQGDSILGYPNVPLGSFWMEVIQDQGTGYYQIANQTMEHDGDVLHYTIILDGDALQVSSFLPVSGATQVETDASQVQIVVEFNDAIREGCLSGTYFKLKKGTQIVSLAAVDHVLENGVPVTHKVRLGPSQNLASASVYTIEVSKDVKEDSGKTLGVTLYSSFTTKDSAPPAVIAVEPPADPDCHHPLTAGNMVTVVLTCSEPLDPSSVNAQTVSVVLDGGSALSGYYGLELDNKRIRFTSLDTLQANTRYTVTVLGLKDAAGNPQTQAGVYKFCTRDSESPSVAIVLDSKIQNNHVIEAQIYTLTADVGGATDIDRVEWSVNDGAPTTKTTPPYAFGFAAPAPTGESLTIAAVAWDYSGNSGQARVDLTVDDNANPVITEFTLDKAGQEVHAGDVIKAVGKAYDDVELEQMTLIVFAPGDIEVARIPKNTSTCDNPASPCSVSFSYTMPAGAAPGTWKFKVEVRDSLEQTTPSQFLSATVPLPAEMGYPTAAFLCPTDGAILPAGYFPALKAHIEDAQGLKRVEIERDGVLIFAQDYVSGTAQDVTVQETVPEGALPPAGSVRHYKVKVVDTNDLNDEDVITVTSVTGPAIPNGADLSNFTGPNATVIIDGGETGYVCAGANCAFKNVVVLNGGVLTHYNTTASTVMKMDFAAEKVYVECGGKIDASGKGYLTRYTYRNAWAYPSAYYAAGSYGGQGGRYSGTADQPMPVYGSLMNPMDPGSGSGGDGGDAGGGIIRAEIAALIVDGEIAVDDTPGVHLPGAGGTLNLRVRTISGSGTLHATGGSSEVNNGVLSGGGGRVAIHYVQNLLKRSDGAVSVSAPAGRYSAGGALLSGGAGTVYWFQDGFDTYGNIIIDNTGTVNSATPRPTLLPAVGTGTIGSIQWLNGDPSSGLAVMTDADAAFPWSLEGHHIRIYQNDGTTEFATLRILRNGSETLTSNSLVLEIPAGTDLQVLEGKPYRGVLKLDALDVRGNAVLQTPDLIELHGNQILWGNGRIDAEVEVFGSVEFVHSGAQPIADETKTLNGVWTVHSDVRVGNHVILTHSPATAAEEYRFDLNVDGTLTIAENGKINVDGRGYLNRRTYPNTVAFPIGYFSGGSYGGYGGKQSDLFTPHMPVYGSFIDPAEVGSGYGHDEGTGGSGGGAVRLKAGTLRVLGSISSDGTISGKPGSGGSINLDVGTLEGTGGIHANGGPGPSNSGGGGRIAVRYLDNVLDPTAVVEAKGGINSYGGTTTGGAGTVYWFDKANSTHGDLVVDNAGIAHAADSRSTPLPSVGSGSVLAVNGGVITCQGDADGWAAFPHSVVGLWLRLFDGDMVVGTYRILAQDGNTLTVEGLPTIEDPTVLRYRGVVRLDSLTVAGGAYLLSDDIIETGTALEPATLLNVGASVTVQGDLALTGVTGRIRELTVTGNLTLSGGSILTVPEPSPWNVYPLTLNVGGTLTIDSTSAIDVNGKGYVRRYTYPNVLKYATAAGGADLAGGTHGGNTGYAGEEALVLTSPVSTPYVGRALLAPTSTAPMTVDFDYKIARYKGGDGMVFMFYKDTAYTPTGESSLGFQGSGTFQGYGIEIDTAGDAGISSPHIALIKDDVNNHLVDVEFPSIPLDDGAWHRMHVEIGQNRIACYRDSVLLFIWEGMPDTTYGGLGFGAANSYWTQNWYLIDNLRIEFNNDPSDVLTDDFARPSVLWKRFEGHTYWNDRQVYGDLRRPAEPGSGGVGDAGVEGGGVIKINAGQVDVQGKILADGETYWSGSGAGGSIWITADQIQGGSGTQIYARGGGDRFPGSGGRIAIYGPTAVTPDKISARGGANTYGTYQANGFTGSDGAPGTIYYGTGDRLVVNATNTGDTSKYPNTTPIPRVGSGTVAAVTQESGAPIQWFRVDGEGISVPMSNYAAAEASHSNDYDHTAVNIIDGKTQTYWWAPGGLRTYAYVDLRSINPISTIRFLNSAYSTRRTADFRLAVAQRPDFSDAQIVASGTLPNTSSPEWQAVNLASPLPGRFVIFYADSWYSGGAGLDELEVIATANPYALSTPYLFAGSSIYFNDDLSKRYTVVGNDPLDRSKIFVKKGANADLSAILTPGTSTFQGIYQFSACEAWGGAQVFSHDDLDCGAYNHDASSFIIAPDDPAFIQAPTLTTDVTGSLYAGQTVTATVTASGRAMTLATLQVSGVVTETRTQAINSSTLNQPFAIAIPTDTPGGLLNLMAVVRDALGFEYVASVPPITVTADTAPPVVGSIVLSAGPEIQEGTVFDAAVSVTDDVHVGRVEFAFNGETIIVNAPTSGSEYMASFIAPNVAETTPLTLSATAYDDAHNWTKQETTVTITLVAGGTPPVVTFQCPSAFGVYPPGYTITVTASAVDDSAVKRIEFFFNGSTIPFAGADLEPGQTTLTAEYALPATGGHYSIAATAYDYAGQPGTATIWITVPTGAVTIFDATHNPTVNKIDAGVTTYDNTSVFIIGKTFAVDGVHSFNNVAVLGSGVLNHSDATTSVVYQLNLTTPPSGQIYIECGSKIDVTGRGYDPDRTYPNSATGATTGNQSAGSHGGVGGRATTETLGGAFGSFTDPIEPGGGSGAVAGGGGIVRLDAGSVGVDGEIAANGAVNGITCGGAGGSIQIRTGTIAIGGSAAIRANGGAGDRSGGGGRIAIYYEEDAHGNLSEKAQARGGASSAADTAADLIDNVGGAGTVYLFDTAGTDASTNGVLILDNTGASTYTTPHVGQPTPLPAVGSGIIDAAAWKDGNPATGLMMLTDNEANFPWNLAGLTLRLDPDTAAASDYKIKESTAGALTSRVIYVEMPPETNPAALVGRSYAGVIKLDTLQVKGFAWLKTTDRIEADTVDLQGGSLVESDGRWDVAGDFRVGSQSVLSHSDTTGTTVNKLEVHVGGTMTVDSDATVNVTGKGYDSERTYPNSVTGATTGDYSSGSHAGIGGRASTETVGSAYGSYADPIEPGGGAGSVQSGGGVVWIQARTMDLYGLIQADGVGDSTRAGAGGSIQLHVAGDIGGTGTIRAKGGDASNGRSGAGGRVAVYYGTDAMGLPGRVIARGGNGVGETTYYDNLGGAGTIFLKGNEQAYGSLIVSNAGVNVPNNSQPTPPPAVGSGVIDTAVWKGGSPASGVALVADNEANFPYNLAGLYLRVYLGPDPDDIVDYRIAATEGGALTSHVLHVEMPPGSDPSTLENKAYSGVMKLDSIAVAGNATVQSVDALECGSITVNDGGKLIMHNYPVVQTQISSDLPNPVAPGTTFTVTLAASTTSPKQLQSVTLNVTGAYPYTETRTVSGTSASQVFTVTIPSTVTTGSVTIAGLVTDTYLWTYPTTSLSSVIESTSVPVISNIQASPASPEEGADFTVSAGAAPGDGGAGIAHVSFTFNGRAIIDDAAPYAASFRAPAVPDTVSMPVDIEAEDTSGASATAVFDMTVVARADAVQPQVTLSTECLTPLFCQDCTLPVPVTATDDQAISRIEVLREGTDLVASITDVGSASYSGTIDVPMTAPGAQTFRIRVVDYGDNSVTSDFPMEVVPGVLFDASTGDAHIAEDDPSYDNQSVFIRAVTLAVDGEHAFGDVVLLDGAVLTHSDTGPGEEHRMELHVNRLRVGCDARVDVSGMGYDPGFTYPNTLVGGAVGTAAGSHGGVGGHDIGAEAPAAYGSVLYPSAPGGGGGPAGASGGGVVVIDALQSVTVQGEMAADGLSAAGSAGAGGSIQIITPEIRVTGSIHARGGDGDRSGGGGRIAVHYALDASGDLGARLSARQGRQPSDTQQWVGGTGSVYLNHTGGTPDRRLFIDPENEINWKSNPSVIPSIGEGTTDADSFQFVDAQTADVTITGAAFPWSVEGHYLRIFTGPSDTDYTDFEVLPGQDPIVAGSTLRVRIPDGVTDLAPYQGNPYRGVVKLEELSLMDCQYGRLASDDLLEIQGDLTWTDVCAYLDAELRVMGNLTVTNSDWLEWNRPVRAEGNLTLNYCYILSQYEPDSDHAISLLELEAGGRLTISAGSYLDAGHGYAPGTTYPGVPVAGPFGTSSSGSHGGVGGVQAGDAVVPTYGSFIEPMEAGAGGGGSGAWGGGVIRLKAAELHVDGNLYARGDYGSTSAGAGGSILIEAGDLDLYGNVYASGNTPSTGGSGSGGGRIAVYYRRNVGSLLWKDWLYAGGGCKSTYTSAQMGGAGTVFIFNTDETAGSTYGDLVLNQPYGNPYQIATRPTVLPSVGSGTTAAGALTWTDPSNRLAVFTVPGADFSWNLSGLYLRIYLAGDGSDWTDFPILGPVSSAAAGDAFYIEVPAGVDDLDPYNENRMYQGIVKLDSLTVRNGAVLKTDDLVEVTGSVVVDTGGQVQADMMKDGALTIDGYIKERTLPWIVPGDLRLINGAVLTHPPTDATEEHKLILRVAGTLEIDAASRIDVSAKGYLPGIGYGNTADTGTVGSQAAGSHGGMGGIMTETDTAGSTYGSPFNPVDSGAGAGAVNAGGGVVWIEADRVVAAGDILADGEGVAGSVDGGGAGGSIQIRAREMQFDGVLSASGAPGATTGGGGRIALYYETSLGDPLEQHCRVWTGALTGWDEALKGSPGTVLLFNTALGSGSINGRLIVDAGPDNGASWIHGTVLPGVGEGTTGVGALVVEDAAERVALFTVPDAAFPWSLEGLYLRIFTVEDRSVFTDFPILGNATADPFTDTLRVRIPDDVDLDLLSIYNEKSYQGVLKLDDLALKYSALVVASDPVAIPGSVIWADGWYGELRGPGLNIGGDLTITNGYDFYTAAPLTVGGDILLDGGYLDSTRVEAAGSVVLINTSEMFILYAPTCEQEPYPLDITAHTSFEMDASSTIYGDWYGYCPGRTYLNSTEGASAGGSGGSHAGLGGAAPGGAQAAAYGAFYAPKEAGAGQGTETGGTGGGALSIHSPRVVVGGLIEVDGQYGAAAGSILIDAGTVEVGGSITANGGDDTYSGGGGRIAVFYQTDVLGDLPDHLQARGGISSAPEGASIGGAGTLFLFDSDATVDGVASTYGSLIVDNTGAGTLGLATQPTPVVSIGTGAVESFSSTDDPAVWACVKSGVDGFPYSPEGAYIEFTGAWIAGPYVILGLDSADPRVLYFKIDDASNPPAPATGTGYSGSYRLDSIDVRGGAQLVFTDPLYDCPNISITVGTISSSDLTAPNYTVSGGCQ